MSIQLYSPNDLTSEENYALAYAYALIGGETSLAWKRFQIGNEQAKKSMTLADLREALRKGLNGLLAKGLIDAEKDGEGHWTPTVVHVERLVPAARILQS